MRYRTGLILGCVLLAGTILRIAYFYEIRYLPRFSHPTGDEAFHDFIARANITGNWSTRGHSTGAAFQRTLVWCAWTRRKRNYATPYIANLIAVLAGILIIISPVFLRNIAVSGEPVPISSQSGRNLYLGNNPGTDGIRAVIPGLRHLTGSDAWNLFELPRLREGFKRVSGRAWTYRQMDFVFAKRAVRYVKDHPKQWAKLTLKKALLFWGPNEVSGDRVVHYDLYSSPILRNIPVKFPTLLVLSILGLAI